MRCIYTNSVGLEVEHSHKAKLKVLTPLNFLTSPSFSVTLPGFIDGEACSTLKPSFVTLI